MEDLNKKPLDVLAQLAIAETGVINAKAWSAGEQAKKHCDFALTAIATARQAIAAAEQAQQITDGTRVAWTSLGTVKAMLPELLASDDVKVRENAQIIDALVKLVGCQQQAEPVAREFFAYDPECGFETFRTEAEAKKYAQDSIDSYREEASEGWPELVNNICWGVVLGATREVELPDEYNGCNGLAGYMKPVDYVLTDAAQPPAVACNHRIADARNPVVSSGYVCVDCGALFSAADHNEPPAVAVPGRLSYKNATQEFADGYNACIDAMLAAAPQAASEKPDLMAQLRALARQHGWNFVWAKAKQIEEGTKTCHKCHGNGLTHSYRCVHYDKAKEQEAMAEYRAAAQKGGAE